MPVLAGVTVYRISDLPPMARPPSQAFFEIAYEGQNYKVPLTAVSLPEEAVVIETTPSTALQAGMNAFIVLRAPATVQLPPVVADDVGKTVTIKRLYTAPTPSTVQTSGGQTIFDVNASSDLLDSMNRAIVYKAVPGGWVRV